MSVVIAGANSFRVKGSVKSLSVEEATELREVTARLGVSVDIEEVLGSATATLELSLDENLRKKFDRVCLDAKVEGDKDTQLEAAVLFLLNRYRSTVGKSEDDAPRFSVGALTVPQIDAAVSAGVISEERGDRIKGGEERIGPKNINALKEWLATQA